MEHLRVYRQMVKRNKGKIILTYIMIFIFFLWCTWNTPLTGDDWTWQSHLGVYRLKHFFDEYNGRYLSNLLEIALVRVSWLRILFQSICSTLLIYLISKITMKKVTYATVLSIFIFLMTIPQTVYAQTFGWTAGYVNYIVSLIALLTYFIIILNIFEEKEPTYKPYTIYLVATLGLLTQLLVEHITLFSIYSAILVIIYAKIKFHRFFKLHITYLIASIVGAVIMFSNSAYMQIIFGKDDYREISNKSLIEKTVQIYSGSMHRLLFENNVWIVLCISIVGLAIFGKYNASTKCMKYIKYFVVSTLYSYSVITLLATSSFIQLIFKRHELVLSLFSILFFISLCLIPLAIDQMKVRIFSWYLLSGVVLLSAPFVFITPYGPRCAIASIVFLLLFAYVLINYYGEKYQLSFSIWNKPAIVISVVIALYFAIALHQNGRVDRERLAEINKAVANKEPIITIRAIPNAKFHWMTEPEEHVFMTKYFKRAHKIPKKTKIIIKK